MVKKLVLSLVIVVLVIGLMLAGCTQPAPAPTTTAPAPKPSPTPAATTTTAPLPTTTSATTAKTLKFSTALPEPSNIGKVMKTWAQRIDEQSAGKLKIQLFFSGSLVPSVDMIRGLQSGMCDIAYYNVGTNTGSLPLMEMARLPFMGLGPLDKGASVMRQIYNKFPEMQKEFQSKGLTPMAIVCFTPEQFFFTKKEVRVPADVKGLKIIARGYWPQVLEGTGVACLNLNMEDWYTSLERGLADGHVINFLSGVAFKTLELLKVHTMIGEGGGSLVTSTFSMNTQVLNSLPADLQKVLLDNSKWFEAEQAKCDGGDEQFGIDTAKKANHTFINLTAPEIQQWYVLAKPVHEKYIADNAAAGPTRAIYDEIQKLVK